MGNQINQSQIKNTSVPQYLSVTLTSAEILDLVANPKELVPAPDGTQIILPYFLSVTVKTTGNTPYNAGSAALRLKWGTNSCFDNVTVPVAAFAAADDAVSPAYTAKIFDGSRTEPTANLLGQPLILSNIGSDFTVGNAPATVQIYYNIVTP